MVLLLTSVFVFHWAACLFWLISTRGPQVGHKHDKDFRARECLGAARMGDVHAYTSRLMHSYAYTWGAYFRTQIHAWGAYSRTQLLATSGFASRSSTKFKSQEWGQ